MSTSAPPIAKALGRLVGSMYADHVKARPAIIVRGWEVKCACSADGPDRSCDLGEALWRVKRAEERRHDDGRNPRR